MLTLKYKEGRKKMNDLLKKILFFLLIVNANYSLIAQDTDYFGLKPPGISPELFMPGVISTGAHDMSLTISNDLSKIYLRRSSLNWSSTILFFEKGNEGWKAPRIASFAKSLDNSYPFFSPDNSHFYFNSSRPLPGDTSEKSISKIWFCESQNGNWSEPKVLESDTDPEVNMTSPSIAKSGNIYFYSTEIAGLGNADIYCIKKTAEGYGKPENLGPNINTDEWEFHPYISPDEDYIIFDAAREEGFGSNDLYISFKKPDGSWSNAMNMGKTINSEDLEVRPYVSPDGKYLFFCSNRGINSKKLNYQELNYSKFSEIVNGPGNGSQDIYWMDAGIIYEFKSKILNDFSQ